MAERAKSSGRLNICLSAILQHTIVSLPHPGFTSSSEIFFAPDCCQGINGSFSPL